MQKRTIIRTAMDKFFDNVFVETVAGFVNFCNEDKYFSQKELKFLKKMPINNLKVEQYDNRFIFNTKK